MNPNHTARTAGTGVAQKRGPHSIRFFDDEWTRIEAFAGDRGLAPAEFVRFAALAAIEDGDDAPMGELGLLIERTFRFTYILATRKRDEMIEAGEKEALDDLIGAAYKVQDELLRDASE